MGIAPRALRLLLRHYLRLRTSTAPQYRSPSEPELSSIEAWLAELGMACEDYYVDPAEFQEFARNTRFSHSYHGGEAGGVYAEKLLEHFVALKLLDLSSLVNGSYIDIAACASPWARILREDGLDAHAIDLKVSAEFADLPYYHQMDATQSSFPDASVAATSLQCAFEMFYGDNDISLLTELARILMPGGKTVISPLYMHTHACHYQTPEYYGHVPGDPGSTAYVRRDSWGVPSSRKYSPATLRTRIWDHALAVGLKPRLLVLRNKSKLGTGIYLHFILLLEKPMSPGTGSQERR